MKHNGSMHRTRSQTNTYKKYRKTVTEECQFCAFITDAEQVLVEHEHFWIVRNIFPYDVWDDYRVAEHLMLVPKRHVVSLADFSDSEKSEYMELIAAYEQRGYSIYSRTDLSPTKSVPHQHTHLICIDPRPINTLYYSNFPHVLIYR